MAQLTNGYSGFVEDFARIRTGILKPSLDLKKLAGAV